MRTIQPKIKKIADHYGLDTQLTKLAEECAEYSAACLKWHVYVDLTNNRANPSHKYFSELSDKAGSACIAELADVLILARQIEYLMKEDEALKIFVEIDMNKKIDRQLRRIEEELAEGETK